MALCLFVLAACRDEPARPAIQDTPTRPASNTGWVPIPGGLTHVGDDEGLPHEQPVFAAEVAAFQMQRSPVTVAQFRDFAARTGYVTDAERFGSAGLLAHEAWRMVEGATWQHPLGPASSAAPDDHPVTQVSWNDAAAFCAFAGGRLPTEIEWEHAARGARDDRRSYAWGDSLATHDHGAVHYHANTWNGTFPVQNTAADGYHTTSPVGAFGTTELGLTDMGGNVWEWTADWYRPYGERNTPFTPTAESEKAQRGGSFLCHPSYCHGYRVSARSHSTPETSLFHVGFRCARDAA